MSKNHHKRRKNRKKKEVPRCEICGSPLISFDKWVRLHYDDVVSGKIPEPQFWNEIKAAVDQEKHDKNE